LLDVCSMSARCLLDRVNGVLLFRQSRRDREGGNFFPGPAMFGGPAVAWKYKVHQNAPSHQHNSKIFSPDGPRENV